MRALTLTEERYASMSRKNRQKREGWEDCMSCWEGPDQKGMRLRLIIMEEGGGEVGAVFS